MGRLKGLRQRVKGWLREQSPNTLNVVSGVVTGVRQAPLIRHYRRWRIASSYSRSRRASARRWILQSTEESNFLYDVSPSSRRDLALMLASFMKAQPEEVQGLFAEILDCQEIDTFRREPGRSSVYPGRREAWYVVARLIKPRTVVETGVADGLGALVLLSALRRNDLDGHPGRYIGSDIVADAGAWARDLMRPHDQFILGPSIEAPGAIDSPIDLLILDSDHDPRYEATELMTLGAMLSPRGVVISDNCHVSDALRNFSQSHGRPFMIWREEPLNHWYPGASLGLSLPPSRDLKSTA